jgi:NAD+--asparagine ADP-ribosyltransferase
MQAELEKVKELTIPKVKRRPLSCNFKIDVDAVTEQNYEDLKSATYRNMDQEQLVNKEDAYETNNGDDIDEDLIEEDDQDDDSDDIDEEDEDE